MSTLRFELAYRENGALTSVRLPGGTSSGGLLVDEGDRLVFVLFAEEEVEVGDEVVAPPGRRFTVASVHRGTLNDHPVTALEVRGRDTPPTDRAS